MALSKLQHHHSYIGLVVGASACWPSWPQKEPSFQAERNGGQCSLYPILTSSLFPQSLHHVSRKC